MSGVGLVSGCRATRRRSATAVVSILLLALAGGLALGGCGGEEELSRGEYERELRDAARETELAFEGIGSELRSVGAGSASLVGAAERVDALRDRLEERAERLDGLDPPEGADAAHDRLVEGMNELADELAAFRDAVDNGDVQRLHEVAERIRDHTSLRKIDTATRELESQGYDLGR